MANPVALSSLGDVTGDNGVNIVDAQQIARFSVALSAVARVNAIHTPTAARIVVGAVSPTVHLGRSGQVLAVTFDANDNRLTGCAPVTWTSSDPAIVGVNASGHVTGVALGTATVTATSGAQSASVSITTIPATAPLALAVTIAPSAQVANCGPFAIQPVVQLVDANGNAAAEAGRVVTVSSLNTTISAGTATTGSNGAAAFSTLAICTAFIGPGPRTLDFRSNGLTSTSAAVTIMGAGFPAELEVSVQVVSAQSGIPFPTQPVVTLKDLDGGRARVAGILVTAKVVSGPGIIGGTTTAVTDIDGVATFSGLMITGAASNSQQVELTAPGIQRSLFSVTVR